MSLKNLHWISSIKKQFYSQLWRCPIALKHILEESNKRTVDIDLSEEDNLNSLVKNNTKPSVRRDLQLIVSMWG